MFKLKFKVIKPNKSLVLELRVVTCHMGSHSITCHPTQVNPPLNSSRTYAGNRFTYPWQMEGWVHLDYTRQFAMQCCFGTTILMLLHCVFSCWMKTLPGLQTCPMQCACSVLRRISTDRTPSAAEYAENVVCLPGAYWVRLHLIIRYPIVEHEG